MASFAFTAKTKGGDIQKGNLVAADRPSAAATLIDRGLVPIVIKAVPIGGAKTGLIGRFKFGGGIKLEDKVVFSRQFATMINAGVPIVQALGIMGQQTSNKRFQAIIADLAKQVEGGSNLSGALASHTDVFSSTYVNMVKAGEAGGLLDEVLERLAVQQEKDAEVVGKVRSAMIYPAILLTVTLGAFIFLMVYLVPHMSVIFSSLDVKLPWYSQLMLTLSSFFVHFGLGLAIVLVGGGVAGIRFIHTPRGKRVFDRILVHLPIIGPIIVKMNVARFARTLGSLMGAGLSVLDALNTTSTSLSNSVFQESLLEVAKEVKAGKTISVPLGHMTIFPPIVVQMIAVGEETGKLDEILIKLAGFYEREVDTVVAGLTSVIEPIMIVALGGVVGFVVVGVYGPLAALNGSV